MSLTATERIEASVEITVRVPRGDDGDLEAGVAEVLLNVPDVALVTLGPVEGVRPTWTDVRVDATADLAFEGPEGPVGADGVADRLADAFGVTAVHDVTVDEPG